MLYAQKLQVILLVLRVQKQSRRSWWPSTLTHMSLGDPNCNFENAIFNLVSLIVIFSSYHDNAIRWIPRNLTDNNIGSGNGLVLSGNKPASEPMFTQFLVTICKATMSWTCDVRSWTSLLLRDLALKIPKQNGQHPGIFLMHFLE